MASLTGTLNTETRGKSMVQGDAAAPSFVGSLLNVATGAVQAATPMLQRMKAQDSKDALNNAEQARFDFLNQKEEQLNPAFKAAGDELSKSQTAEDQGRVPSGSTELRAEKVVSDLYSRFPGDKASIAQYLQGRGFDHFLFQEVQQEEKWKALEADSERAAYQASMQAAVNAGAWDPNNPEASVKSGQAILAANMEIGLAQKKADLAISLQKEKREQSIFELNQASKQGVDAAVKIAGAYTNVLIPQISTLVTTAGGDQQRQEMIAKAAPQVIASLEAFRAGTKARMPWLTKDALEAFDAQIDDSINSVNTLLNSQFETNKKVLDNMRTQFAIDDATAIPAYSRIVRLFGQDTANAIFAGDPSSVLPDDVVEQIRKEVIGLKGQNDTQASITIANIAAIKNGTKGIADMSEEQARRVMPTIVKMSSANQGSILKTGVTEQNASEFYNSQSQVINAGSELQPGLTDMRSISTAVDAVANARMGQTLTALQKSGTLGSRFDPLVTGNRGVTAQLLRVAQQSGPDSLGVWNIVWDGKNGTYKVQPDAAKLAAARKNAGTAGIAVTEGQIAPAAGGAATDIETPPPSLMQKATTMNTALNHLIATSPLDDNLPKGASNLELRKFYALGTPPASAAAEKSTPGEDWEKSFRRLQGAVERVTLTGGSEIVTDAAIGEAQTAAAAPPPTASFKGASISPGDAVSRFQGHGVPIHIAQGIVGNLMAESGLKTGAVGDGGKAMSLAQWHPDRRAHAVKAGFDLSNPQDAIDFVMWELNNTEGAAKKKLAAAKTVQEAADIFALYFLRPQGAQTGNAENVHNISGRRKFAQGLAQR